MASLVPSEHTPFIREHIIGDADAIAAGANIAHLVTARYKVLSWPLWPDNGLYLSEQDNCQWYATFPKHNVRENCVGLYPMGDFHPIHIPDILRSMPETGVHMLREPGYSILDEE